MNIERIAPIGDEGKDKKAGKASSPDSEAFREMMKVGKTRETELDERNRRKLPKREEDIEEENPVESERAPPSESDIYYYRQAEKEAGASKELPESELFWNKASAKKIDPKKKAKMIETLEHEIKKEKIQVAPGPTFETGKKMEKKPPSITTAPKPTVKSEEKKILKTAPFSEKGEKIKEAPLLKTPEKEKVHKEETGDIKKGKKAKAAEKEKAPSSQGIVLPQNILLEAQTIASKVEAALNKEIVPIFEEIVGTIMYLEQKGISTTTIILDNPKFAASRFYGAEITFEKYSTDPTSYNIRLTGSQEAVTIFLDNLDGLYKSLKDADLDFEVGRLIAEYKEIRPLIKRKPGAHGMGKEAKNE